MKRTIKDISNLKGKKVLLKYIKIKIILHIEEHHNQI